MAPRNSVNRYQYQLYRYNDAYCAVFRNGRHVLIGAAAAAAAAAAVIASYVRKIQFGAGNILIF